MPNELVVEQVQEIPKLSREQIRETFEYLGLPIERAEEGSPIYLECPFKDHHTKPTRSKDTRLYFDEYPHLWCFHESCHEERRELNYTLRVAILGTASYPENSRISFHAPSAESHEFARAVTEQRSKIFRKFCRRMRPLARVNITPVQFLERLFKPDDVLWVGLTSHTGQQSHARHFRTLAHWMTSPPAPRWAYTTGCTFKPGSFSRCAAAVLVRRFLILESDSCTADETRALFEWVEHAFDIKLRAIVFSGGKSLHGWFDYSGDAWLADARASLLAAGFCPGPMSSSQPVRLANAIRETGKEQTLLWM